ncbi:MAG: hypothetical protein ABIF10_01745 [Candidatus Woesearchaeota archaeon]
MQDLEKLLYEEHTKYNQRLDRIRKCVGEFKGGISPLYNENLCDKHLEVVMVPEEMDHGIGGNWYQVLNMAEFASADLKDIMDLELETAKAYVSEFKKGYNELLSQNEGIFHILQNAHKAERYSHAFFSRISTLLDNLYYLVSRYYYIDTARTVESGASIRKAIEAGVKKYNPRLSCFLKQHFGFSNRQKEFNSLRNPFLHNTPKLFIQPDIKPSEEPMRPQELVSFAYNAYVLFSDEPRKEKLFDYLFSFYQHSLGNAHQAYTMVLESKRPAKEGQ